MHAPGALLMNTELIIESHALDGGKILALIAWEPDLGRIMRSRAWQTLASSAAGGLSVSPKRVAVSMATNRFVPDQQSYKY